MKTFYLFLSMFFAVTVSMAQPANKFSHQDFRKGHNTLKNKRHEAGTRMQPGIRSRFSSASIQENKNPLKQLLSSKLRLDSLKEVAYNPDNGLWEDSYLLQFRYDLFGNDTSYLSSTVNESGTGLQPEYRESHRYDAQNRIIQSVTSMWNPGIDNWELSEKIIYVYNADGTEKGAVISWWYPEVSSWVETFRYDNLYEIPGKITTVNYYYIPEGSTVWTIMTKDVNQYDNARNLKTRINYYWDGTDWSPNNKDEYTYSAGNLTKTTYYEWNSDTGGWAEMSEDKFTFDSFGNIQQSVSSAWDDTMGEMAEYGKEEYTYDNTYSSGDLILPHDIFKEYFTHKLNKITGFYYDGSSWTEAYRMTTHYSVLDFTAVAEKGPAAVKLYPNPATGHVTFDFSKSAPQPELFISDLTGRRMLDCRLQPGNAVNVSGLSSGTYIYTIQQNGKTASGKLVIR